MANFRWNKVISSRATSQPTAGHRDAHGAQRRRIQMASFKFHITVMAALALGLNSSTRAFAHDDPTGIHISTKSPQAHAFFEKGLAKIEMLHTQDALENFRNAVKADP